jgi:TRAP-type C4-dicarboxylate transport system substrate-binding protein
MKPTHERRDPLALKPDPAKAAQACRTLIRAYGVDPSHVDWSDVQDALQQALDAFRLPETFIETEGGHWR